MKVKAGLVAAVEALVFLSLGWSLAPLTRAADSSPSPAPMGFRALTNAYLGSTNWHTNWVTASPLKPIASDDEQTPVWLKGAWKVIGISGNPGGFDVAKLQFLYIDSLHKNDGLSPHMANGFVLEGVAVVNLSGRYVPNYDVDRMYINDRTLLLGTLNPLSFRYTVVDDHKALVLTLTECRLELIKLTNEVEIRGVSNIFGKFTKRFHSPSE